MRLGLLLCACTLSVACAAQEPPLPPVPPAPEDLSTWVVPELVQAPPVPPPSLPERKLTPAEQVLTFTEGATFPLTVQVGVPLDLILEYGESVRNLVGETSLAPEPPADGEGPAAAGGGKKAGPWTVEEGAAGMGETLRPHIFLSARKVGLTLSVIITTSHRTYYLSCKSVAKSPVRVVRWKYPEESSGQAGKPQEPGLLPDPAHPTLYHVGYTLTSSKPQAPDWMPRYVVDDGKKIFVVYPEIALFQTVPVVRMIGPNGPQLVNARQFLNVVIADQLAPRLELRVGIGEQAEVVTIARGQLRTIECPGDPACPVWPQAAAILARRATR